MVAGTAATVGTGAESRRFYLWMGWACLAIAFVGFAPTYWLNLVRGTMGHAAPIMHIHGALFFSWTFYFVWQASLVANGRVALHRASGLAGIAIASAMVCAAIGVTVSSIHYAVSIGQREAGEAFAVVPFTAAILFAVLIGLAIGNISRPEHHKRWMLVATISLMQPAIARWFIYFLAPPAVPPLPPAPLAVTILPGLISDVLVIVAMIYDWRSRGRPHVVYLWGGAALVFVQVIRLPLGASLAWLAFAHGLSGLFG